MSDDADWTGGAGGNSGRQVTQRRYDRETDGELVTAVTRAIAEAKGVDPLDSSAMAPLHEYIDPEALEATIFPPTVGDRTDESGSVVTFRYEGSQVTVRHDGWILVAEPE